MNNKFVNNKFFINKFDNESINFLSEKIIKVGYIILHRLN